MFATLLCLDVIMYMFSNLYLRFFLLIFSLFSRLIPCRAFLEMYRMISCSWRTWTEEVYDVSESDVRSYPAGTSLVGMLCHILHECVLDVGENCMISPVTDSYHYIRSISGFKTYLIINMLSMFDLLLTSIEHVCPFSEPERACYHSHFKSHSFGLS